MLYTCASTALKQHLRMLRSQCLHAPCNQRVAMVAAHLTACALRACLVLQDLARAQVHAADAVFIMADKRPADAHQE
jgi:hypothetical protein